MIVFPMVGKSSRFSNAGFTQPKYRLKAFGNSILFHIIRNFQSESIDDEFLFVLQDSAFEENFVRREAEKAGLSESKIRIVRLPEMTAGQAETAALGLRAANCLPDDRVVIFNADTIRVDFKLPDPSKLETFDGLLEVFQGPGDHWSFAKVESRRTLEETGIENATAVAEKQRISDLCSNGLYYFKSAALFLSLYDEAKVQELKSGELYVAPLLQKLIEKDGRVGAILVPRSNMHFCGTPDEYHEFCELNAPLGIEIPERFYIEELLRLSSSGRSKAEFFSIIDFLSKFPHSLNGKISRNLFSTILDSYAELDSFSVYTYAALSLRKGDANFQAFLKKSRPIFEERLTISHKVHADRKKAMNFSAALLSLYGADPLINLSDSFKFAFHAVSLKAHRSVFRVTRNSISSYKLVRFGVDLKEETPSVSYLFMLLILTFLWPSTARKDVWDYIEEKVDTAKSMGPYDEKIREIISKKIRGARLSPSTPPAEMKTKLSAESAPIGALLISGQMRNDNFVSKLRSLPAFRDFDLRVFVSTWNLRGSPPSHFGSLRGYREDVGQAIREVVLKHDISPDVFNKYFAYRSDERVSHDEIVSRYSADGIHIDEEGVTCDRFADNQERLFYKLDSVFKLVPNPEDFDFFLRVRPDLSFDYDPAVVETCIKECVLDPNVIYLRHAPLYDMHFPFLDDNLAIAGNRAIAKYCGVWEEYKKKNAALPFDEKTGKIIPHSTLALSLLSADVDVRFLEPIKNWKYNSVNTCGPKDYINFIESRSDASPELSRAFIERISQIGEV